MNNLFPWQKENQKAFFYKIVIVFCTTKAIAFSPAFSCCVHLFLSIFLIAPPGPETTLPPTTIDPRTGSFAVVGLARHAGIAVHGLPGFLLLCQALQLCKGRRTSGGSSRLRHGGMKKGWWLILRTLYSQHQSKVKRSSWWWMFDWLAFWLQKTRLWLRGRTHQSHSCSFLFPWRFYPKGLVNYYLMRMPDIKMSQTIV